MKIERMNLFFIHTPFQLFVVHQIIHFKKLKNNLALFGYVNTNRHFYDIYKLMELSGVFQKVYYFDDLETWALVKLHKPLTCIIDINRSYKKIKSIIKENSVTNLYLGDINNFSCRFSAYVFGRKGININFYEEGASHYSYQKHIYTMNRFVGGVLSWIYDMFLYIPIFGYRYARWRFIEDIPLNLLPMNRRYSILGLYHEKYDEVIKVYPLIPNKIENYIKKDLEAIREFDEDKVLYISSPVYEEFGELGYKLFLEYLSDYIKHRENKSFVIKYHPRDTEQFKEDFKSILESNKINYYVLSNEINIPMEYYLQCFRFPQMATFLSSVSFYNGIIYSHSNIEDLDLEYLMLCKKNNIPNIDIYIERCEILLKNKD